MAQLFWTMLAGALILWVLLSGLFFHVTRIRPQTIDRRYANMLIVGGGLVLPALLIGAPLVWGLSILPDQRQAGDGLTIRVPGRAMVLAPRILARAGRCSHRFGQRDPDAGGRTGGLSA